MQPIWPNFWLDWQCYVDLKNLTLINFKRCRTFFTDLSIHGLRTPYEGVNPRNLTIWADVADKICFGHTYLPKHLRVGVDFWPCSEGDFLTGRL